MGPESRRWIRFNGVGALGMAVQFAVLTALVRMGIHSIVATAIAVEAAVLHNFIWHQHWTWRDRPVPHWRERVVRLAQFQALNGAISLLGNVAIVAALTSHARLDPLAASAIAIAVCSLLNYAASSRLVFRHRALLRRTAAGATVLTVMCAPPLHAADGEPLAVGAPSPATLAAWQAYEQGVERRFASGSDREFFALDAFGDRTWRAKAMSGSVPMVQLESAMPREARQDVRGGRIHHWAGAVFVPGMTVAALVDSLAAHGGRESESYADVSASRLMERQGDHLRVFMRLKRTKIITATYNTEHDVTYRRLSPSRATGRSIATKIVELADAGTPRQREKRPDEDNGFLWRLNAYWRYEATAGGVLIECESVSLSRDVPYMLRFMISGMVEGVARDSLERTLTSLRQALSHAAPQQHE